MFEIHLELYLGRERGRVLSKFADLLEQNSVELATLETLDNGKPLAMAKAADIPLSIEHYRFFAGYADKVYGRTIPIDNGNFFAYTLHEPIGVRRPESCNIPHSPSNANFNDSGHWSNYSLEFPVVDDGLENCTGFGNG